MHWMFPDCDLMQRLWTDKYGMFYSNVKVVYKVESASRLKGKKKKKNPQYFHPHKLRVSISADIFSQPALVYSNF